MSGSLYGVRPVLCIHARGYLTGHLRSSSCFTDSIIRLFSSNDSAVPREPRGGYRGVP